MTPKPANHPAEQISKLFTFQYSASYYFSCIQYFVAPKANGLPAELTPKLVAAQMAASLAKSFLANPKQSADAKLTP